LNSYKQALRLNNEVPGIVIPEPLLKSMEAAGAAARDRGFEVARDMLAWARTELAGAYLIPPFKRYEEILEILYRGIRVWRFVVAGLQTDKLCPVACIRIARRSSGSRITYSNPTKTGAIIPHTTMACQMVVHSSLTAIHTPA